MQKIKKLQRQINKLISLYREGKCKNKYSLEKKIEKLSNELKIAKDCHIKLMEAKYWQNEATY